MRIIPAIDVIDGKCVRLTKGDYSTRRTYRDDPLEVALEFEAQGIKYLHLVDLDGARSAHIVNYKVLERITNKTSLQVDFGGGIKSDEDARIALESGASQITGGSIAAKDPELFLSWLERYGAQRLILGADALYGKIAISGWQEESQLELLPFIQRYLREGIKYVVCTDISRDGMLQGPAFHLYKTLLEATSPDTRGSETGRSAQGMALIASGGVSDTEDLIKLKKIGCEGAIIGKALYEGTMKLSDLESLLE
jgi:phosphoribosylformimino-5-aminoimidazole carboxamide ribotide isomerase